MTDTNTLTRANFLREYREVLKQNGGWTSDPIKLDRFMASCETTLAGGSGWDWAGKAAKATYNRLGGKGQPTLKALRALP